MKSAYYAKVQCHNTVKYRKKQHYQCYIALPAELCRIWDLEKCRVVRLAINGNGEVLLTKADSKPVLEKLTYSKWLERIKPYIPTQQPGKTHEQICKEAGIPYKSPPAIWVNWAKNDIRLNNQFKDPKTHRTLWIQTPENSITMPKARDTKITDPKFLTIAASR